MDDDGEKPVSVGPYMIFKSLGNGAVGTVYQGVLDSDDHVDGLPDVVAIKIQQRRYTPYIVDGSVPREAWAMTQLRGQRNVAQLVAHVDDTEQSDLVALIMEFIDGAKTLDTVQMLGPQHALAAAQQLLSALAVCERRRIVHGDMKPDNVVFAHTSGDGEPQYTLIDFGAAQFPRARAPLGNPLGESLPSDAATAAMNIADEDSAEGLWERLHTNGSTSAQHLYELTNDSVSVSLSLSLAMDAPPDDGVITPSLQVAATPPPPPAYADSPPIGQRPSHASSHPESPSPTLAGSLRPQHRRLVRQFGAPGYAAPEIAVGSPISTASDMFSLGIVLFQVTCGKLPHAETGDVATWLETVFCAPPPGPPPSAIDSVSVSSADRGTGSGEGSLPSPASTAACAASPASPASPASQLEGAQFPNWAAWGTADGTPPHQSPPCDTANAVADAATMHRQDSDLPPGARATAVGQSAVVTADRMAAALVANGLDSARWDLSGKDAWFPKLLVRLLQPEPFDRGSPANALLGL
jgi:serine/threonine protein kinase